MSAKGRKKQKKREGGGFVLSSLSAIVICIALVLGVSVFFRVSIIEISGATRYSDSEIIEASGIKEGSNLVFLNREAAEEKILNSLVYVGRVSVKRSLPNKVVIEIHESGTVACILTEDGYWLIDEYCRLLEECPDGESSNFVSVTGFDVSSPKAGKGMNVAEEDKSKLDYLETLLTALSRADMLKEVNGIDMSTSGNPQFEYMGRFRVKLGKNENLDSKLAMLAGAVETMSDTEAGVFDLSEAKKASFTPG